ncbi:TerD domain-containing protein [Metabacillus sp. cB07]|uniref:TerD family protein n=1 Tax=Metabacillus sp. cB07 TaxID=2806989 RepID=UPI00193938F6|nr:TerD domain-containing protein [Metabacillus sp. cB07]
MLVQRGQKADVTKGKQVDRLTVRLGFQSANPDMEIDGAAFLLGENGTCGQDEDFIFYGQQFSRNGAVEHSKGSRGSQEEVKISLSSLPGDVRKIAFTLTIHEGTERGHHFKDVSGIYLQVADASGAELIRFECGEELSLETAIVAGELYVHNGEWKFSAIGSGFHNGLEGLCANFGIEVKDEPQEEAAAAIEEPPAKEPEPVQPLKINLEKKQTVSIKKSARVTTVLKWDSKKDLDLYCFYVLKNGESRKVYYKELGKANQAPFITLDGDSKIAGSETIIIHKPEELRYALFAAYSAISNGFGSFKSMKARAVVDNHQGQVVTAPLFHKNWFAYWVAIAHLDFTDPSSMSVSHVETYSKSGSERSPMLYPDGTFKMDEGPIEFKRN